MGLWKLTLAALLIVCSLAIGTTLDTIINDNAKLDFKDGIVFSVLVCLVIGLMLI